MSKKKYCCDKMRDEFEDWNCDQHFDKYECPDAVIDYTERLDEYWIIIHWTPSYNVINYCPWCWLELKSKRELWFNELEKLWFSDPIFDENIPEEYKSNKWYN